MAGTIRFRTTYSLVPALDSAKCYSYPNPDWFFDDVIKDRGGREHAPLQKQFCKDCPVINQCLEYAMKVDVHGVWGGTTYYERKQIRRQLGLKAEQIGRYEDRGTNDEEERRVA